MPKVKIDTSKSRAQKRYNYVAGVLSGGFRQNNMSTDDVSRKTGIPARTVTDRLKRPEEIRLKDLYALADAAGVQIIFRMEEVI